MERALVTCSDVHFSYGAVEVIEAIDLFIEEGAFTGVIGPNGSGKTTLVKIIAGLLKPSRGEVVLDGSPMNSLSKRRVAQSIALVQQSEIPEFGLTVREMVMLGRSPHHGGLHFDGEADRKIVENALRRTDVASLADRKLNELSGGELQRVRIARGLAQEPKLLILDEPTNHLDLYARMSLAELMQELNHAGLAVLVVSHNIDFVAANCRKIIILQGKTFHAVGSPQEVITAENIAHAFKIRALVDINPVTGLPRIHPLERLPV